MIIAEFVDLCIIKDIKRKCPSLNEEQLSAISNVIYDYLSLLVHSIGASLRNAVDKALEEEAKDD